MTISKSEGNKEQPNSPLLVGHNGFFPNEKDILKSRRLFFFFFLFLPILFSAFLFCYQNRPRRNDPWHLSHYEKISFCTVAIFECRQLALSMFILTTCEMCYTTVPYAGLHKDAFCCAAKACQQCLWGAAVTSGGKGRQKASLWALWTQPLRGCYLYLVQ